jgi:hypothetical protein
MKVFAKKPFDWNKFLDDRLKGVPMEKGEFTKAKNRAMGWATCACGNQCAVIPRNEVGEPIDGELYHLGLEFFEDIQSKNWKKSKETLEMIECRSSEIINEIKKEAEKQLKIMGYKVVKA